MINYDKIEEGVLPYHVISDRQQGCWFHLGLTFVTFVEREVVEVEG